MSYRAQQIAQRLEADRLAHQETQFERDMKRKAVARTATIWAGVGIVWGCLALVAAVTL